MQSITKELLEKLSFISAFVFDIDGTLTDGTLYVLPDGTLARRMCIKDGYAIHRAIQEGYPVIVISGARGEGVRERLHRLGVTEIYTGINDKLSLLQELIIRYELLPENVLCAGDDIPDIPMLELAGVGACPKNAASEVKEIADWIVSKKSGDGCIREIIQTVLALHGRWNTLPRLNDYP